MVRNIQYDIVYNGRTYSAKNAAELAKKMNTDIASATFIFQTHKAGKYDESQQYIYAYKTDGTLFKYDTRGKFKELMRKNLDVKRITKKDILLGKNKNQAIRNGKLIVKDISKVDIIKQNVSVRITIIMYVTFYQEVTVEQFKELVDNDPDILENDNALKDLGVETRIKGNLMYRGPMSGIEKFVNDQIRQYVRGNLTLVYHKTMVQDYNDTPLEYKNQQLRDDKSLIITQWTNIEHISNKKGTNCVIEYLKNNFPNTFDESNLTKFQNFPGGITMGSVALFLLDNNFLVKYYTEKGRFIYSSEKEVEEENKRIREKNKKKYDNAKDKSKVKFKKEKDASKMTTIRMVVFNNHIYPFSKSKLVRPNATNQEIFVDNILENIKQTLKDKISPDDIIVRDTIEKENGRIIYRGPKVISYSYIEKNIKKIYIENPEYKKCLRILKIFKCESKINYSTRINHLPSIIISNYLTDNIKSFFPNHLIYKKNAYTHIDKTLINEIKEGKYKLYGLDKNKCYTYALYSLPYLIVCDWRTSKITKNPKEIVDEYLYVAKPAESTVLMPNQNYYPGYFLKYCRQFKIKFELLEEMTAKAVPNCFKYVIDTIKDYVTEKELKEMWNIYIGNMTSTKTVSSYYESCIRTDESAAYEEGIKDIKIDDDYYIHNTTINKSCDAYNMKPIDIQIKDYSRSLLFEKILEICIVDVHQIIKINTDSITFASTEEINMNEKFKLNSKDFMGWKENNDFNFDIEYDPPHNENVTFVPKKRYNIFSNSELHKCYAGTGKTYHIINELVPKLENMKKKYLILTPTHRSTIEFRDCPNISNESINVIQYFEYNNEIPRVDAIIVDEIGMVGIKGHDFLYKMKLLGKDIYAFGDFNQILPPEIDEPFNSKQYESLMYDYIYENKNNRRNNFPISYYDKLINKEINLVNEVKKYSTKNSLDADFVACYRIETMKSYNSEILRKKGFKSRYERGVRVMCTSRELSKCGIYNGQLYIVQGTEKLKEGNKEKRKVMLKLMDCEDANIVSIRYCDFNKYFSLAYAININKFQGSQLSSYYWANEDSYFLTPRIAYTIISRLKGNHYHKYTKEEELEMINNAAPCITKQNIEIDLMKVNRKGANTHGSIF